VHRALTGTPLRSLQTEGPLATVVIPTCTHARHVGEAIESVLRQQYRPVEIIVVDSGSSDDTARIVGEFGAAVCYVRQENRGLSAARNAGIRLAAGEYVGLLDADDLYEPQFLRILVGELERNPEAMAIHCGYRFVDDRNQPLPQVEARDVAPHQLFGALADGNFLVPESMLVRRRCYDEVGAFDVTLKAIEDLDMWLRIARRYKVLGSTRILTRHRVLPPSTSADPELTLRNRLRVLEKHFGPESAEPDDLTEIRRRAYGRAYLSATVEHLQVGRDGRAAQLFRRMCDVCPSLLFELETFYELACGGQARGYRGDFDSLDLVHSARWLDDQLRRTPIVFREFDDRRRSERRIRATASFALGLLHYGRRERSQARRALVRAAAADPALLMNRRFVSSLARAMVYGRLMGEPRRRRPALSPITD
jgi:glycosyltransferase involved in cell wall biosynthesis